MFQSLLELAGFVDDAGTLVDSLNEGMPANYDRGIALCFDAQGAWLGPRAWDRHGEVVYRSGPPQGRDRTAVSKVSKTHLVRLKRYADDAASLPGNPNATWWSKVAEQLAGESVKGEVDAAVSESSSADHRAYVFVARLDQGSISPAWTFPEAEEMLTASHWQDLEKGGSDRLGMCCVCGAGPVTVYGNFSDLACYNLDKPGAIAGGMRREHAVRNFPVCRDCASRLPGVVNHAKTELRGYAGGQPYLLLPSASDRELRAFLHDSVKAGKFQWRLARGRDPLDSLQDDLLGAAVELAREGRAADLSFRVVFFKEKNAEWRIRREARHVLPTRLAELQAAARSVERDDPERGFDTRTLASLAGNGPAGTRQVEEWVCALLEGRTVPRGRFVHTVCASVVHAQRKASREGSAWLQRAVVLDAWRLLRFAHSVGLVPTPEVPLSVPDSASSPYAAYCREHPEFFGSVATYAAFLAGCYASVVCSAQHKARGDEPFARKFRGRLVDGRLAERLYREGRDKLAAYDALGWVLGNGLDGDLADALVAVSGRWNEASVDEISLAFSIGTALQRRISKSPEPSESPE